LRNQDVVPDPELENWSQGRGQHVQYRSDERSTIPLTFESELGNGATARVESVRCMRVRLVRKVIRCNIRTRLKRDDALQEVLHLYRAQHSHIVRLVGTYVIDDELVILTYPSAEWNLEQFMSTASTAPDAGERSKTVCRFFICLARALYFIHSFPIKHMDIKPQNILVRDIRRSPLNDSDPYKIYLTDFGSSKFYPSVEDTETDGFTPFTRGYAAPEVVLQETRGLPADVFSMGCVFTEMLATVLSIPAVLAEGQLPTVAMQRQDSLRQARAGTDGKPRPYYFKAFEVSKWLESLSTVPEELGKVRHWIFLMLDIAPSKRPTARWIAEDTSLPKPCISCTHRPGPEDFEAALRLMAPSIATA
jgi:serine/threonine protein kinase